MQTDLHQQIITYAVSESTVLCVANHYEILTMRGLFSVLILKKAFLLSPHRAGKTYFTKGPHPVTSCSVHGQRKKGKPCIFV